MSSNQGSVCPPLSPGFPAQCGALQMSTLASLGFSGLQGIAQDTCYSRLKAEAWGIVAPELFNHTLLIFIMGGLSGQAWMLMSLMLI